MELIKRSMVALVMLLVVLLVWAGLYIYFESSKLDIDPKAEEHTTTQLNESFNLEELDNIVERTEENLPVSPEVFLSLIGRE
jgi:hypothetical protein